MESIDTKKKDVKFATRVFLDEEGKLAVDGFAVLRIPYLEIPENQNGK